jgi:glutamate-1-semialdehyde 2,1-aminomutase
MYLKKNYIMNEGYDNIQNLFSSGIGSKIQINRKKFLDLSLCAGSLILGHNSKVFKDSLNEVSKSNISNFAAKNIYAYNFSQTLKKVFPGYSKFIYCNSGTEAVFKSLRVARAITKKKLIISVTGSWHGSTSELLYSSDSKLNNIELSQGLEKQAKKNIKFIPYNNILFSKKILDKYKRKIMCIIIEPIQACLPQDAKEYLKFLNDYSEKNKILMIFDEMITGIRFNCSSAQNEFKLNPSISTFGKILGGGLPMGIIALKKDVVKKLNKNNKKVFFGGTFSGNSINTFVANKVINYILKNKRNIFEDLEKKSNFLEAELNNFFQEENYDAKCFRSFSMLRIVFTKKNVKNRFQRDFFEKRKNEKVNKFKKFLLSKNIYYPTNGIIFLARSTTFNDLKYLLKMIKIGFKKVF